MMKNKTEISVDDYENMKQKDIEDLLNQKTKAINERKAVQIQRLLIIMRNQTLACLATVDFLYLGVVLRQFGLVFMLNVFILLAVKIAIAIIEIRKARKK